MPRVEDALVDAARLLQHRADTCAGASISKARRRRIAQLTKKIGNSTYQVASEGIAEKLISNMLGGY
jgi:anti-sigma28 factor (negative regulator of flagellin synthesis)